MKRISHNTFGQIWITLLNTFDGLYIWLFQYCLTSGSRNFQSYADNVPWNFSFQSALESFEHGGSWLCYTCCNKRACFVLSFALQLWMIKHFSISPQSLDPKRWRAFVGKHHLQYQDLFEQEHTINQIIMHEGYDQETVANDIAILVLDDHVMFNGYVMPICLPAFSLGALLTHHAHSHVYGLVAGWGDTRGKT